MYVIIYDIETSSFLGNSRQTDLGRKFRRKLAYLRITMAR